MSNSTPTILSKKDLQNFVQTQLGQALFYNEQEVVQKIIGGEFDYCDNPSIMSSLQGEALHIAMMNMAASSLIHVIVVIKTIGSANEKLIFEYMNASISSTETTMQEKLFSMIILMSTASAKKVLNEFDDLVK